MLACRVRTGESGIGPGSFSGQENDRQQQYGNDDYRTEPDHPPAVIIMILEPDDHTEHHVNHKQDYGNGSYHVLCCTVTGQGRVLVLRMLPGLRERFSPRCQPATPSRLRQIP